MDNLLYVLSEEIEQLREKVVNKKNLKINLRYLDDAYGNVQVHGNRLIDSENMLSVWFIRKTDVNFEIKMSRVRCVPHNKDIAELLNRFQTKKALPSNRIKRITLYNSMHGGVVELRVSDGRSLFDYNSC